MQLCFGTFSIWAWPASDYGLWRIVNESHIRHPIPFPVSQPSSPQRGLQRGRCGRLMVLAVSRGGCLQTGLSRSVLLSDGAPPPPSVERRQEEHCHPSVLLGIPSQIRGASGHLNVCVEANRHVEEASLWKGTHELSSHVAGTNSLV